MGGGGGAHNHGMAEGRGGTQSWHGGGKGGVIMTWRGGGGHNHLQSSLAAERT